MHSWQARVSVRCPLLSASCLPHAKVTQFCRFAKSKQLIKLNAVSRGALAVSCSKSKNSRRICKTAFWHVKVICWNAYILKHIPASSLWISFYVASRDAMTGIRMPANWQRPFIFIRPIAFFYLWFGTTFFCSFCTKSVFYFVRNSVVLVILSIFASVTAWCRYHVFSVT